MRQWHVRYCKEGSTVCGGQALPKIEHQMSLIMLRKKNPPSQDMPHLIIDR